MMETFLKNISNNYNNIIIAGIALMLIVSLLDLFLFFVFSKVKNPIAVKVPLIISFITAIFFTAGFMCSVGMPLFMKERVWSHFLTISIIAAYFIFFFGSFIFSYLLGQRELKSYKNSIDEKGIVLGVRNMPDGSTAINPKWFKMGWSSLFTNALILGGIGSGKTSSVLLKFIQQICLMNKSRPSVFVLDVKGDLYETVKLWNHPRKKDLVCYGYGYTETNMLGSEDVIKTVNNIGKAFQYLNEGGQSNVYYSGIQTDYLKMMIHLFRLFFLRPLIDESNRYIFNRFFLFKDDQNSENIWKLFQLGTGLTARSFQGIPTYKKQTIPLESSEYDSLFLSEKDTFIRADDFTLKDIYTIMNDLKLSRILYIYIREYLLYLEITKQSWDKFSELESVLNSYRIFVFNKDFEKNINGLKAPLSTISDQSISRFFNARNKTVDFANDINSGKIIFINVPEGNLGKDVARLIGILFLFQYLSSLNSRNSVIGGMDKERPVFILIDEFFKFINEELMNFTSTARSARVCNILLGQSLGQFPPSYKDSIKSNLRTKIVFSIGDEVTAEEMSRYLGEGKTTRKSKSQSYGVNSSQSRSEAELFDRKIKPHDLIEMAPWKAAVSHFDGSRTLPVEIVDFPPWFKDGFNIFPVEHAFLFYYETVTVEGDLKKKPVPIPRDTAKEFLLLLKKFCGRRIRLSEITVSGANMYFCLSYRYSVDPKARPFIEKNAAKIGKSYDFDIKQCSYDELLAIKKKLKLPDCNVRL